MGVTLEALTAPPALATHPGRKMEDTPAPIDRDARIMARRQRISERIAAGKGDSEGMRARPTDSETALLTLLPPQFTDSKRKQKGEKEHEESRSKAQIAESRARIDKIKVWRRTQAPCRARNAHPRAYFACPGVARRPPGVAHRPPLLRADNRRGRRDQGADHGRQPRE